MYFSYTCISYFLFQEPSLLYLIKKNKKIIKKNIKGKDLKFCPFLCVFYNVRRNVELFYDYVSE